MNFKHFVAHGPALSMALTTALLVGCGGGGGASDPSLQGVVTAEVPAVSASSPAVESAPPVVASEVQLALAMVSDNTSDPAATTPPPSSDTATRLDYVPVAIAPPPAAASAVLDVVVATPPTSTSAQAAAASTPAATPVTAPSTTPTTPPTTTPVATTSAVAAVPGIYYVDSRSGDDANDGSLPTQQATGKGPWKSLARLAKASLLPGNAIRLACGSEWGETLSIGASGTAASPITIAGYPTGCASKPVINGAATLPASSWTQYKGNIYQARLATAPSLVFGTNGTMTVAHHPNRGHDPASPESLFARLASDSDATLIGDRKRSTYISAGSDLKIPPGVTIAPGTQVRIRANAWLMEDRSVESVTGTRIKLDAPSTYPLTAGWGYFLLNQLWMLDEPGEWFFDKATSTIYAWMPDSRAPAQAVQVAVLGTGIDLRNASHVTIDGLSIRRVGVGLNLRGSTSISVRNSLVEDTADVGVDAVSSTGLTIQENTFNRTGRDAISGQDDLSPHASGMRVLSNRISESGTIVQNARVASLPGRNYAAIRTGPNGLVNGNVVSSTGYIGIQASQNSTVSDNLVENACLVLDDGAAIYALGDKNNSLIENNLIRHSVGAVPGKSPEYSYTQAQGIFLDESSSGVTVRGNSVFDADNGLQIHNGNNNKIDANRFVGNRIAQIWLQETRNTTRVSGDLFDNQLTGNQIVPMSASAKAVYLDTSISSTVAFGSFDRNRYHDSTYPIVAIDRTPTSRTDLTFPEWQAASSAGTPRLLDPNGASTSQTKLASVLINGSNVIPNANLASDLNGWSSWNLTKPLGTLVREACPLGWCAKYTAGASAGLVSMPNFSTVAGTWYRLTIDISTGVDDQAVDIVIRRGGGGTNGYETISDRPIKFKANRQWGRFSYIFKVNASITAGDAITKDLGARLDIQNVQPGQWLSVANVELLPITPAEALTRTEVLVNATSAAQLASCPTASLQPTSCGLFVRLADDAPIVWPYALPARSATVVYTRDARLVDSDSDGIADGQDACPNSALGMAVNAAGCSLTQR